MFSELLNYPLSHTLKKSFQNYINKTYVVSRKIKCKKQAEVRSEKDKKSR